MEASTERLNGELERAALHAILRTWEDLNGALFRFQLQRPAVELVDSSARLGRWHGGLRVIEIARTLLLDHGWGVLVEVLKHEMAHQYVHEILGELAESAHGPAFREARQLHWCRRRRLTRPYNRRCIWNLNSKGAAAHKSMWIH